MIRSLRWRLILGTTGAMAAVYLVMAVVLYVAIQRSLWTEFDGGLMAKAQAIMGLAEQGDKGIKIDLEPGQFGPEKASEGFAVWTDEGREIMASPAMQNFSRPAFSAAAIGPSYDFVRLANGRRVRVAVVRFLPRLEDEERPPTVDQRRLLTLAVARDTAPLDRKLQQLVGLLAGLCILTVLLAAAAMVWMIRRGLRPLRTLAGRIHRLDENELGERLAIADTPSEIQPVVERLNELLARLDASFAHERSFTADVAHELRTPLAGLTTALQVCHSQRRSTEEYENVIDRCLGASRAMRGMVENLLTLARADARQLTIHPQPIEIVSLLKEVWAAFEHRAAERRIEVAWTASPSIAILTDRNLVEAVIRNLLDNAVTYTNEGGRIDVQCQREATGVSLTIRNTGCQIPSNDAENVFERFWRGDTARPLGGQHCGLGLALCRRIANLLGGTIRAEVTTDGMFGIVLALPSLLPEDR